MERMKKRKLPFYTSSDFLALRRRALCTRDGRRRRRRRRRRRVDRRLGPAELTFVRALVVALDLLDHRRHLLDLPVPLLLAHLGLAREELDVGRAVAAAESIPERRELPKVVPEVEMMQRVAGGAVDDRRIGHVLAVVWSRLRAVSIDVPGRREM